MFGASKKAENVDALLPDEPSGKNYFLEKGFFDLGCTIKESFKANGKTASKSFSSIKSLKYTGAGKAAMGVLYFFAGVAVVLFGTMLTLLISIVHSIIVLIIMSLVYAGLGLSKLIDGLYRHTLGLSVVCDRCKLKTELPGYCCPVCGKTHYRLKPNVYGILVHKCECGQKLPAAFFVRTKNKSTGETYSRAKLDAVCGNPNCEARVYPDESRPVTITIAGSQSVGKTAYLTAVSHELIEEALPKVGCTVTHYTPEKETMYLAATKDYKSGEVAKTIEPTDREKPSAFSLSFFVEHAKLKPKRLVHIFDIAGETFTRNAEHERQLQYSYAGVILIVDPMAIPEMLDRYESELDEIDALGIGDEDPNQVLSAFVAKMQNAGVISTGKQIEVPVAIVINKIDQPGVKNVFSDDAVSDYEMAHPGCGEGDAIDCMCRDFLKENRMGNFVTTVDVNFKTVRYFACSSIGHTRGQGTYKPKGVLEPVTWVAKQTDKQFARFLYAGSE